MRLRRLVLSCFAASVLATSATAADPQDVQTFPLETSDKPLETVLQYISRRANVNVVCNEADQPRVTIRLANVTWQEAVDQIARKYDFVVERRNERIWELTKPPKVRMEFQNAGLGVVLEALARQAGVNIVIGDEIDTKRRISMTLNGVPWREALDVIVKSLGYAWAEQDYNIIRIVKKENLTKDLETRILRMVNVKSDDASTLAILTGQLEQGEKIVPHASSNSLVITASRASIVKVERMLPAIDVADRQVLIELRFVDFLTREAEAKGMDTLGFAWDVANLGRFGLGFGASSTGLFGATTSFRRPEDSAPSRSTRPSIAAVFELLAQLNSTQILQAPQLLTKNTEQAQLIIGGKTRFAEVKSTTAPETGVNSKTLAEAASSPIETGVKIKVRPIIKNDGRIELELEVTDDSLLRFNKFSASDDEGSETIQLPETAETKLKTTVVVRDGQVAVMGGILKNNVIEEEQFTPVLGRLPLLGWLFKNRQNSVEQRNLTIFISPRIVPLNTETEFDRSRAALREQLSGIPALPATPVEPALTE
jgi:type IV pilus assembly protein PilQ